jgi:hypothetical protein
MKPVNTPSAQNADHSQLRQMVHTVVTLLRGVNIAGLRDGQHGFGMDLLRPERL